MSKMRFMVAVGLGLVVSLAAASLPANAAGLFQRMLQYAPPAGMTISNMRPTNRLMLQMRHNVNPQFLEQIVSYQTGERPGTIVVDTQHHFLYFVLGGGRALRYGIGTAKTGFEWSGIHQVTRKAEWPSWTSPAEMIARRPDIPHFMAGGVANPLGARALYIGSTLYRIHGTNEPWTIGGDVSSGCIRMTNESVMDLYSRVQIGTKVIVL